MYNAYITRIKDIRKHSNADRLQCAEVFGNSVIIGLTTEEDELGIYFPADGKLGIEYCTKNNLLINKDENGVNTGGYLDPDRRHITTLKLRGEKSDGLFMPLNSLESFIDIKKLKEGDMISILNGTLICEKYIPKGKRQRTEGVQKTKRKKVQTDFFPIFDEHADTSQLAYNIHEFKYNDLCHITLKMHGTSGRTTHTIKETKKVLPLWLYKITQFLKINNTKKSWEYVSGTRKVILNTFDGGYYGSNAFRKQWHDIFVDKLYKGETIYYEIVGYTDNGGTIMPECANSKTKDKDFIKEYGETTKFTYGCEYSKSDIYAYRMTMTNEDGIVTEYPWHTVKVRCEQMGIKTVPELDKFLYTTQEDLLERLEKFTEGVDPIGKTHTREGVVVRIENRMKFAAYKNKSFIFKLLEGLIKADNILDIEEEQSIVDDYNE